MNRQKDNETKPTEQEINLSRRSKIILETSIDGFCVIGLDGKLLEVNSSFCDISGYSREELLRMKILDIDALETAEQTAQHLDKAMKQGYDRFETKHRRKDGKLIDIEVSSQYCDLDEETFFFSFFRDITDLKLSIDMLKKSERVYKTLCNNIPGMVYRATPDWLTEIVTNSEVVCNYCPEDINSKKVNWIDIIHPDDRERVLNEAAQQLSNKSTTIQEYRIIARDGSVRWVEDHKTSILTEKGVFDGVDGVVFDITARKQAEMQIRDSENRYKVLFQGAAEGIIVADIELKQFMLVNPTICRMLGYSEEEMKRMGVQDIHPKESLEHVFSEFEAQARGEKILSLNIPLLRKDGTIIYVNVNTTNVIIDGRACNIGFFTDITERKRIKADLENYKEKVLKAQRHFYIGSIGAMVAHQVNQPLTKINILLDRALEQIEEASCCPFVAKNIKECLAEAKEATSIIRKFRQYSKDSALEGTDKVNISAVADRIVFVLSERTILAKMRIFIKDLVDLPEVEANETALEQMFLIIIQNALEAADGRKSHKLDITGKFADGDIELRFADDCCGIAPENLDRIFEPFFSTKAEDKGMGLGLDIVQQILIRYGGQIRVESKLGKGTTFYVTLPISNTPGA